MIPHKRRRIFRQTTTCSSPTKGSITSIIDGRSCRRTDTIKRHRRLKCCHIYHSTRCFDRVYAKETSSTDSISRFADYLVAH